MNARSPVNPVHTAAAALLPTLDSICSNIANFEFFLSHPLPFFAIEICCGFSSICSEIPLYGKIFMWENLLKKSRLIFFDDVKLLRI